MLPYIFYAILRKKTLCLCQSHGGLKIRSSNNGRIPIAGIPRKICSSKKFCFQISSLRRWSHNSHIASVNTTTTKSTIIMGNHVATSPNHATANASTNMSPKEAAAFVQNEISTHQVRRFVSFLDAWASCIITSPHSLTHYSIHTCSRLSFSPKVTVVTAQLRNESLKTYHKQRIYKSMNSM